jgi:hypothetical protein
MAARYLSTYRHQQQVKKQPWRMPPNAQVASYSLEHRRAWTNIQRLVAKHGLEMEACGRWMCEPEPWAILRMRFMARPPNTLQQVADQYGTTLENIEARVTRALLKLLTRLLAYDQAIDGQPDGLSGVFQHLGPRLVDTKGYGGDDA